MPELKYTPLYLASSKTTHAVDMTEFLPKECGANANQPNDDRTFRLELAINDGNKNAIQILLANSADPGLLSSQEEQNLALFLFNKRQDIDPEINRRLIEPTVWETLQHQIKEEINKHLAKNSPQSHHS